MTSCQLDCVFKNALETANSETAYSCSIRKIEKPSQYVAARVARSTFMSLVDRSYAVWNAIFDDSNIKIRKEQCANIPAHLNENGIGS